MASKDSKRSVRPAQPSAADSNQTKTRNGRDVRASRLPASLLFAKRKRRKANIPYSLRRSHRYEDVRGKTVDFVELFTSGGFHCVDVRFQDKTALTLEIEPTFVVEPFHSDWKTGNYRPIKRWPLIHSHRL